LDHQSSQQVGQYLAERKIITICKLVFYTQDLCQMYPISHYSESGASSDLLKKGEKVLRPILLCKLV